MRSLSIRKLLCRALTQAGVLHFHTVRRGFTRPLLGLEPLEQRVALSTFLVTNTNSSGSGSFAQAILDANATPGKNTIAFDVNGGGAQTIITSSLPTITNPVVIDATRQPGFNGQPLIQLLSPGPFGNADGLTITCGNSSVRGLAIDGFGTDFRRLGAGIVLVGGGGNIIAGNYLGVDLAGTHGAGNGYGVRVLNSASNIIGGTSPQDRNVIAANRQYGVLITGGAMDNFVEGNYIGIDFTGTIGLGNSIGVAIESSYNTIGGTADGAGNVISSGGDGISLAGSSAGNVVQGNFIGTDATGTRALGNFQSGIRANSSSLNLIGGTEPGARNVISGNGAGAILFGTHSALTGPL
jgi:hypothetical protein